MSLAPAPAHGPGGRLHFEYKDAAHGERHSIHLACCHFVPTPSGPRGDYRYDHDAPGPFIPTESGVAQTAANLIRLWSYYYPASWSCRLVAVYYNADGALEPLERTPDLTGLLPSYPMAGVNAAVVPAHAATKRRFLLLGSSGLRWRLWFSQVPGGDVSKSLRVTPSAGGLDWRDRRVIRYLSGAATGICDAAGERFKPEAHVGVWWARPLEAAPVAGGGDATCPPSLAQQQCGAAARVGDMLDVAYGWTTDRLRFALQSWLTDHQQINNIIATLAGFLPLKLPVSALGFLPATIKDKLGADVTFNPVQIVAQVVNLWETLDFQGAINSMPPLTPGQTDGIRTAIYDALAASGGLQPSTCLDQIQINIAAYPNWIDPSQWMILNYCLRLLGGEWDAFAAEGAAGVGNACAPSDGGGAGGTDTDTPDQYLGPAPPADPQPGWLWLDTSAGTPYPVRVWDADALPEVEGLRDTGFEVPALADGAFAYNPVGSAWAFDAHTGVSANGSGFTGSNDVAPEGRQVGLVQYAGAMSQPFTVAVATSVVLTLAASSRAGYPAEQVIAVLIDGVQVASLAITNTPHYQDYSTPPVPLAAGAHTLALAGTQSADRTAFIDHLRLQGTTPGAWVRVTGGDRGPAGPAGPTGPAGAGSSGVDASGTSLGDCLAFPRGARVCNDAEGTVTIATPEGLHGFDATGITLPGGSRLEVVEA